MTEEPQANARRRRLSPEARRRQIVEAAAAMVLEQGHLPLPLDRLAAAAGVSKALIYNYFPTQQALFNAVLEREFEALDARGLQAASRKKTLDEAALATAGLYFEHVAETGPLAHIILRDAYMTGHVAPGVRAARDRVMLRLARLARRRLRLEAKENIAAITMVSTIPEEAGRLVRRGEMSFERGRMLCDELIAASLEAFRPQAR